MDSVTTWQWLLYLALGLSLFIISPVAKSPRDFYKAAATPEQAPGVWLLMSGLVIAWIFAKSITNAANLGASYGLVGGVAYGGYYASFIVGGLVIYRLRTRGGFGSIHEFLTTKYGRGAVAFFSVLIAFRLFNEVWSNTMVIGSYFGAKGSTAYYGAIVLFTVLTLAYVLKGGLKTSVLTDAIQMLLFTVLLAVILGVLLPRQGVQVAPFVESGTWSAAHGLNLLWVALLQVFSYPFHDPVLTDRGFISSPRTTLASYALATVVGFACIVLFSFVGIYARLQGLEGEAPVVVARSLGTGMMLVMNLIMLTSAGSTLDSTFSSFSKLVVVDLGRAERVSVARGRLAMAALAVLGTVPVFLGPEILAATTISGTMVLGLAPVFLLWRLRAPATAFHASVGAGVAVGLLFAFNWLPAWCVFIDGPYGDLLSVNIIGTVVCFALFFTATLLHRVLGRRDAGSAPAALKTSKSGIIT